MWPGGGGGFNHGGLKKGVGDVVDGWMDPADVGITPGFRGRAGGVWGWVCLQSSPFSASEVVVIGDWKWDLPIRENSALSVFFGGRPLHCTLGQLALAGRSDHLAFFTLFACWKHQEK